MNIYYSLTLCQCTIIKETCRVPVLFKNAPDIHTRAFINIFSMNYLCILFFNKDRKFVFAAGMALKCSWYLNIFKHIVTLNSILFGNKNFRKFRAHFLRMVSSFKLFSGLQGLWVRIFRWKLPPKCILHEDRSNHSEYQTYEFILCGPWIQVYAWRRQISWRCWCSLFLRLIRWFLYRAVEVLYFCFLQWWNSISRFRRYCAWSTLLIQLSEFFLAF